VQLIVGQWWDSRPRSKQRQSGRWIKEEHRKAAVSVFRAILDKPYDRLEGERMGLTGRLIEEFT
jgi:hypothetical protein